MNTLNTEVLYESVGIWEKNVRELIWDQWLWKFDCNALPIEQCWDMNQMHIYGVLIAIDESLQPDKQSFSIPELLPKCKYPELSCIYLHGNKKINDFSLRELLDQIECLQLNCGKIIGNLMDEDDVDCIYVLLKQCLKRMGTIAHHAYQNEGNVLDDVQYVNPLPKNMTMVLVKKQNINLTQNIEYGIISRKSLRQGICIFYALFRVYFIISKSTFVDKQDEQHIQRVLLALKQHHIESSIDFYNVFQQMVYLAPGMRLVYRTNFAGMYNDVSQVIYFHYPRFCRQSQTPLKDIPYSNIHLLPLLTQLIPDIPVYYDDDSYIPGLCPPPPSKKEERVSLDTNLKTLKILETKKTHEESKIIWAWLVSCGEIFLLKENIVHNEQKLIQNQRTYNIYLSGDHSLLNLVAFLLKETGRKLGDEMLEINDLVIQKNVVNGTAHGHVLI